MVPLCFPQRSITQQPPMKLQPDSFDVQAITGYGPGWVGVNGEKITHSVIVASSGERIEWHAARFEDLGPSHFEQVAKVGAEVPANLYAAVAEVLAWVYRVNRYRYYAEQNAA